MKDRTERKIAFEVFERFFHCHQLEVQAPELGRIAPRSDWCAANSALRVARRAQFRPIQAIAEGCLLFVHLDFD